MIVDDIRVEDDEGGSVLRGMVRVEGPSGSRFPLRTRFEGAPPSWLAATADPFIVALLMPALALEEDLRVDAPATPGLLERVPLIVELLTRWRDAFREWQEALPAVPRTRVVAPAAAPIPPEPGTGLLFTGGIDSFHTLLSRGPELPPVTHLMFVRRWLSRRPGGHEGLSPAGPRRVARELGLPLVVVDTNLEDFADRLVPWSLRHSSALSGVALSLGGVLGRGIISSAFAGRELHPWGSHPELDPMWSSDRTAIEHYGVETARVDKIWSTVARSPLALETLMVCNAEDRGMNCGRCYKCLATMIALHAVGALERSPRFATSLEPGVVRETRFVGATAPVVERSLRAIRSRPQDAALASAIRVALAGSPFPGRTRRWRSAIARKLGRVPAQPASRRPGPGPEA